LRFHAPPCGPVSQSASQLGAWTDAGRAPPEELKEQTLSAIADCGEQVSFAQAPSACKRIEAKITSRRALGGHPTSTFDGLTFVWRDLSDLENMPTTAGSLLEKTKAAASRGAAVAA
jgi:aspartyl-tRNA(Asn)/glutamyl-tRNA(Gln) amidotransferase subunit A